MTLRTPRRRISPRTKRRYRAIREFFRRALGTSQQEIKISSSIAVNVTDLKRKIVGLEQQIDEVSRHCHDIACQESSRRESESLLQSETKTDIAREQTESSDVKANGIETQRSSDSKRDLSKSASREDIRNRIMDYQDFFTEVNKKNEFRKEPTASPKLHKHKTRSAYNDIASPYSEINFLSTVNENDDDYHGRTKHKKKFKEDMYMGDTFPQYYKNKKIKENLKKYEDDDETRLADDKATKNHKTKRTPSRALDHEFIADIIRRQYQPVKLFGRKESDVSQITAPVCRDQELSAKETLVEDSELCSCFYGDVGKHKRSKSRRHELSAMRSVCDTRLYSSKKHLRSRSRRPRVDSYSNADMYDFVPVKERSSPKSRRKFIEDNVAQYALYKEVPPSPKSLRPRLNLKARYGSELDDYLAYNKHSSRKRSPVRQKRYQECVKKYFESDATSDIVPINAALEKKIKHLQQQQTKLKALAEEKLAQEQTPQDTSSLQYRQYVNEQTSITGYSSINKSQENESPPEKTDSTDKTLSEIKQILQSFLHEMKKENLTPCDKSDFSSKSQDNDSTLQNGNLTNIIPNSTSFNAYSGGQCGLPPYAMTPFANPCCYQVMPQVVPPVLPQVVCPMNCPMSMQNGYIMPSQSFTCADCAKTPKETNSSPHCCNKTTEACTPKETDELIKEIYKFVAQTPGRKTEGDELDNTIHESIKTEGKMMTSRSVGDSFNNFQQDIKIGTTLKCISKSCEAIASRMLTEQDYTPTNASHSDTLLEKFSFVHSETEMDTVSTDPAKHKAPNNKLSKVLRSFGLLKKKKKDVIEEVSESESVVDVKPRARSKSPAFRQEVTNYMMHDQEFYQPPPHPPYQTLHDYQQQPYEYPPRAQNYPPQFEEYRQPQRRYSKSPPEYYAEYQRAYSPPRPGYHEHRAHRSMRAHQSAPSPYSKRRPSAPPYSSSYDTSYTHMQPPLCLREIEVKSTGTQSERKMSIFRKIKKKMQPPIVQLVGPGGGDDYHRTFSTQTPQPSKPAMNTSKPFFNWKGLQAKAMQGVQNNTLTDPVAFSIKAQNDLAKDNQKMRKAVLKKLFYKRNPFSPRNLIVRTLMGKDKSSFGEPPQMMRPRMFF